ncbi:MAG: S8 family serine peptidase [Actinomycetota bacterium]|nr:S8 family serine peptidase [Actinomycetota bacterium]
MSGVLQERTYIVRASIEQRTVIASSPAIRWSGRFRPGWKLDRTLMEMTGSDEFEVNVFQVEPRRRAVFRAVDSVPGVEVTSRGSEFSALVRTDRSGLAGIVAIEGVEWIEPRPEFVLLNNEARWVADTGVREVYAATAPGRLTGSGQAAAVADLALNYLPDVKGDALSYFKDCDDGRCLEASYVQARPGGSRGAMFDTVETGTGHRKIAAYFDIRGTGAQGVNPSMHGAHVAGTVTGDIQGDGLWQRFDGIAPGARLVHQNLENAVGSITPPVLTDLYRQSYRPRDPASVPTSWTPADYTSYRPTEDARTQNLSFAIQADAPGSGLRTPSIQTDEFVWNHEDMVVVTAVGNSGDMTPGLTEGPTTAKNDFSSGAGANGSRPMNSIDSLFRFSSRGPTLDGRFGPTVITPGISVISAKGGSRSEAHALEGTSMSAPVLTGLATLTREYFYEGWGPSDGDGFGRGSPSRERSHNPSAALVKAALVNGAERMRGWYTGDSFEARDEDGQWPSNGQGFGRANLDNALFFEGDDLNNWYHDVWRADAEAFTALTGPQQRTYEIEAHPDKPLDVTLAWTDAPNSLVGAGPSLINNLDLTVTSPDGTVYVGNNFNTETDPSADAAFTEPGPAPPDTRNVEERVRILDPSGTYTIKVAAPEVITGPQGFGLAASGALSGGGAPARGPGLLPDEPGGPEVTGVEVEPITSNTALIKWRTDQPTTGTVVLRDGDEVHRFVDSYNVGHDGFAGMEEGPVRTSDAYADKPMWGTDHHALATGLSPGTSYDVIVEAQDRERNFSIAHGPGLESNAAVIGAEAPDIGMLWEDRDPQWMTGNQLYVGSPEEEGGALGAFMFRVPALIDPEDVTGAAVQLHSLHDSTNPYLDDARYVVDLLGEGVEPDWGTQDYADIRDAHMRARTVPTMADRIGGLTPYTYNFSCNQMEALRDSLVIDGGQRKAAFRALGFTDQDESLFSYDFGFNQMSKGPQYRPRLVLFTTDDGESQTDPLPCDPSTPAPHISRLRISPGSTAGGTSAVVGWRTSVPSDSTVLFRERGTEEWHQVGSPVRTTHHMIEIRNLDATKDYEFAVRSEACNGKQRTKKNGGEGFLLTEFGDRPSEGIRPSGAGPEIGRLPETRSPPTERELGFGTARCLPTRRETTASWGRPDL